MSPPKYPSIGSISEICFDKFRKLPKSGKPNQSEWTVLSAIVQFNSKNNESKVVALGCGTKCLGGRQMCEKGLILNDSHAEVVARRAFLRYIYSHIKKIQTKGSEKINILVKNEDKKKFRLADEISFHFFSTEAPCGDACIIEDDEEPKAKKLKCEGKFEKSSTEGEGIIYTGAKLIGNGHLDAMQQDVGAIRIKPGKGDRTLSVSCSDKLSKWSFLGVQGALLDLLLEKPIYFSSINFCCPINLDSIERAIFKRWPSHKFISKKFIPQKPEIRIDSEQSFEYGQSLERSNPCASGLAWCDVDESSRPFEVVVKGKRLGVTKKLLNTSKAALLISKYHLMSEFLEVLELCPFVKELLVLDKDLNSYNYLELKNMSKEYQNAWLDLKENIFQKWTEKPKKLLHFTVSKTADALGAAQ